MTAIKESYQNLPSDFLDAEECQKLYDVATRSKKVLGAHGLARYIHANQTRLSGEPYLRHLERTANNILLWLDPENITPDIENLVCAALLHDSLEDAGVKIETIRQCFGEETAELVVGVSKFKSDSGLTPTQQIESLKRFAQKGYIDPRVFILKLSDRLDNMRTIEYLPLEKAIQKAEETLRVYTKLAESMGMWTVKTELEERSFPYVYPEIYEKVREEVEKDPRLSEDFIQGMIKTLKEIFSNQEIRIEVRKNGLYTLYQKRKSLSEAGKGPQDTFSHIEDVVSFRVIIPEENPARLYELLGKLHTYRDFLGVVDPSGFDDFINQPRENGYSALQTTLNLSVGAVEIALVTKKMEEFNNFGIINQLKIGLDIGSYKRNIVFDETQEAWFLPINATWVDYVYMVGIGPQASHVIVDGKKRDLKEKVENSATVQIIRYPDLKRSPNPEFLEHCLPSTKEIIQKEINLHLLDQSVERGKMLLRKILSPRGILEASDSPQVARVLVVSFKVPSLDWLNYLIGANYISREEVIKVLDEKGITKENLGLTTILVSGKNEVGILKDLASLITNAGGDIYHFSQQQPLTSPRDQFEIRTVVKGLIKEKEDYIRKKLEEDRRFKEVLVV